MGVALLGNLVVNLVTNSTQFVRGLERARARTRALDRATRSLKASVGGLARGFVAAAGIAGLGALVQSTLVATDDMAKFSRQIGISVEAMSELQHGADLAGVETRTLTKGLRQMVDAVSDAAQGGGEAVDALRDLGLNAQVLNRMAPEDQFEAIADALTHVGVAGDRTRISIDLFGGRASQMVQMMENGAAGVRAMRNELADMGGTLTVRTAASIEDLNDAFTRLARTVKITVRDAVASAAPALELMADFFRENLPAALAAAGAAFVGFRTGVLFVVRSVAAGISRFARVLSILPGTLGEAFAAADASLRDFVGFLEGHSASMAQAAEPVEKLTEEVRDNAEVLDVQAGAAERARKALDAQAEAATRAARAAEEYGRKVTQAMQPALTALEALEDALARQADAAAQARKRVFEALGAGASAETVEGFFGDQIQAIEEDARQLLESGIGALDVSRVIEPQLQALRRTADELETGAGARIVQSLTKILQGRAGSTEAGGGPLSFVSQLADDVAETNRQAQILEDRFDDAATAISSSALALRELLPPQEAQHVQARLDAIREGLVAVGDAADVTASLDIHEAMFAVDRIQAELAAIPREIVTVHRVVQAPEDTQASALGALVGSRATGGTITQSGAYYLEAGERVQSRASAVTMEGDVHVHGTGELPTGPAAVAWTRDFLMPAIGRLTRREA